PPSRPAQPGSRRRVPSPNPERSASCDQNSTLALSGGVAGGVHQEAEELGWRIGQQRGAGRGWRILVGAGGPEVSSGGGERIAEGGLRLEVPGGLPRREAVGVRGLSH